VQGVDTNTGVFYGTDIVAVSTGGTERMRINASGQAEFTAGTAALPAITSTGDTNTGVFFPAADTIAFGEGGAEAMRIDSSGNVGIGTTAASSYGRLAVMTPTSNFGFFGIANSVASGGGVNIAQYYGTVKISYIDSTLENGTPGAETARLTFATSTAGTLTERMRITSSGDLLVGCTSQANAARATWQTATNNARYIGFQTVAGAEIGFIFNNTTATQYSTTSDYRLKKDIAPMTGALAKVQALKPVTYKWKSNDSDAEGFIAHELAEICPSAVVGTKDAVNENGDPNYQGIDTSFLVATLTAAIQEQQAMITALTNRITALEVTP